MHEIFIGVSWWCGVTPWPEERYNHQSRTDPSVTAWKSIPNGWEIAEAFDEVIEKAAQSRTNKLTFGAIQLQKGYERIINHIQSYSRYHVALCCIVWSCILKDHVWHELFWALLVFWDVFMLTGQSDELSRLNQPILCNSAWHLHGICMAFAWHLLQVIKPHSWGTHMLIVEGMKAYWTAAGLGRPGTDWDPGTLGPGMALGRCQRHPRTETWQPRSAVGLRKGHWKVGPGWW